MISPARLERFRKVERVNAELKLTYKYVKPMIAQLPKDFSGNMADAARFWGYKIEYKDLGEVRGFLLEVEGAPVIAVNSKDPFERQEYTIAHEIGHWICFHHIREFKKPHWQEIQACTVAFMLIYDLLGYKTLRKYAKYNEELIFGFGSALWAFIKAAFLRLIGRKKSFTYLFVLSFIGIMARLLPDYSRGLNRGN